MRMKFRNESQAELYYKICYRLVKASTKRPEGAKIGREMIRNAIYRAFGYNNFSDFQRNPVLTYKILEWFHSEEQLTTVFTRAIAAAIELVRERALSFDSSTDQLVKMVVNSAMESNDRALQARIARESMAHPAKG